MSNDGLTVIRDQHGHVDVEWVIQNFSGLTCLHGEYLQSPSFSLGDGNWHLEIYPKGKEESRGWISLYLYKTRGMVEHTVSFMCGIKVGDIKFSDAERRVNFHNYTHVSSRYAFMKQNSWGTNQLVERTTIEGHLDTAVSNGAVTVVCAARLLNYRLLDGRHKEVATQTSRVGGMITLSKNLEGLFLGGDNSDVKVKAGEREFDAHKLILSSRSPVFKAMLEHKMVESNSGVIEILGLDPDHVKAFLLYLYTGDFDHVTSENAYGLYCASDMYSLDELKEECRIRMATDVSMDSVLEVILLATVHGETELLVNGTDFFIKNAQEIFLTEKWRLFNMNNASIVKTLLNKMERYMYTNTLKCFKVHLGF